MSTSDRLQDFGGTPFVDRVDVEKLDRALRDSFPGSDAPGWTVVIGIGRPARCSSPVVERMSGGY